MYMDHDWRSVSIVFRVSPSFFCYFRNGLREAATNSAIPIILISNVCVFFSGNNIDIFTSKTEQPISAASKRYVSGENEKRITKTFYHFVMLDRNVLFPIDVGLERL